MQTDYVIEAQRFDLVVVDEKNRNCKIMDFAIPGDGKIEEEKKGKIETYQDIDMELQKLYKFLNCSNF